MMVVDVDGTGSGLVVGTPTSYLDPWPYGMATPRRMYDVDRSGGFYALTQRGEPTETAREALRRIYRVSQLHVDTNWFEKLKARMEGAG